jgi:hypothetical protein
MSEKTLVVYTAIFGKKDLLVEPKTTPSGVDFVCFTDQSFSSRVWRVRNIPPPVPGDPTRSARRVKILAHEYLPEYETSVWVDGNILVRADVREIVNRELQDVAMAVYHHGSSKEFPLHSVKEGAEYLIETAKKGKRQEDPELIEKQIACYEKEGFPDDNGLLWSCVMLRRHNDPKVKTTMGVWWNEVMTKTKRDQMSFNYAAWKTGLSFKYIEEDAADNPYFKRLNHYLSPKQRFVSYVLGVMKRFRRILG